jgi:hypothetical protein
LFPFKEEISLPEIGEVQLLAATENVWKKMVGNEKGNFEVKILKDCLTGTVLDLDPDWFGSASFSRIWIGINSKHMYFLLFS